MIEIEILVEKEDLLEVDIDHEVIEIETEEVIEGHLEVDIDQMIGIKKDIKNKKHLKIYF